MPWSALLPQYDLDFPLAGKNSLTSHAAQRPLLSVRYLKISASVDSTKMPRGWKSSDRNRGSDKMQKTRILTEGFGRKYESLGIRATTDLLGFAKRLRT